MAPLVGEPDGFERLWTPHRMVYIKGEARRDACPFCEAAVPDGPPDAAVSPDAASSPDAAVSPDAVASPPEDDDLVVRRGTGVYVVLNLYPYNPGHLLVCPVRHVADLTDLTPAELAEISRLSQEAMRVLRATSGAAGFNLGLNQGAVAGAGIAGHLHVHVVPRYPGDANFLPIVGRTKALPDLLGTTRDVLRAAWDEHGAPASEEG